MSLGRDEAKLHFLVAPEQLDVGDALNIARLMRECYPEMWGDMTEQKVRELKESQNTFWVGVKVAGELAAFGYATLTPRVSHVTWVATHPSYENRGYATSIVSALVQQCLKVASSAVIYVMDDNVRAKGIYMKVGFRPYRSYSFVKLKT